MSGIIRLAVGKTTAHYHLRRLASDFGRAWQLEKFELDGGETYDVNIDGERSSCECLGFLKHGHCKHADALRVLIGKGKL
jgi:hypothetical protein